MSAVTINSRTLSDAGPWRRYSCEKAGCDCEDQHVVPGFEHRRHELSKLCWCHPHIELVEYGEIVHHNVAQ